MAVNITAAASLSDTNAATETEEASTNLVFSELLESGEEIEGMFQRRKQEQEKKGHRKSLSNGLKDPVSILKERIAIYNKKTEDIYHLSLNQEDLSYCGYLSFQYNNGYQIFTEKVKVQSIDTASQLVPTLLSLFIPQCELNSTQSDANNSYILLNQAGTERELDRAEKPLEIALDCSVKGLSQPTFTLKTSLSYLHLPNTPQNLRKKFSSSSLTTSSYSSLGHCSSEGSESPRVIEVKVENNMYNFDAPHTFYTHPPRSGSGRSIFKSRSQTNAKSVPAHHRALEHTHSKLSDTTLSLGSPTGLLTPEMGHKNWNRSKSKVGNFMEGVARSFKSKRKTRPTSIYPENDNEKEMSMDSPVLTEKRMPMPTVFHIHYPNAKNAQLYKSVLISEHSTTAEVVKQALERYGMKHADPTEFALYEVTGRWEAAVNTLEESIERTLSAPVTPLSPGNTLDKPITTAGPAYEEFVVYYTRELGQDEQPYNVQSFHHAPPGYTRRFEMKSKCKEAESMDSKGSDSLQMSTTPIFGDTSHNHRDKTLRANSTEDLTFNFSNSSPIPINKRNDTKESFEAKSAPILSFLDCSSPDSGLDLKTVTKLSDQNSLYPSELGFTNGYLLNLQLTHQKKEFFIYSLSSNKTLLTTSESIPDSLESYNCCRVKLNSDYPVQCCIHKEMKNECSHFTYCLESLIVNSVLVNGAQITGPTELKHGDLIQIGNSHLFMFQNSNENSSAGDEDDWPYRWYPMKTEGNSTPTYKPIGEVRDSTIKQHSEVVQIDSIEPISPLRMVYMSPTRDDRLDRSPLPTVKEVDSGDDNEDLTDGAVKHSQNEERIRSYSDSKVTKATASNSSNMRSSSSFLKQPKKTNDRKVFFSYSDKEEDALLDILITKLDPLSVQFKLAPVYVISMCLEYNLKCHGTERASKFACKTVSLIQQIIWELSDKIESWQVDITSSNLPLMGISDLLHSVLFWFSNCLEIYNYFLTQQEVLDLIMAVPGEENEQESALTLLENMSQKLFQQAFYPVSKIIYSSLPIMLEEAMYDNHDNDTIVYQTVECLKELLDIMLELHVHTEMIAIYFAYIFFFINGAMFNTLIDLGPEMSLFEYSKAIKLKSSLDILQGWAGKVGFREIILQFLCTFLSAIDLITINPRDLITLSWETLRNEFPYLHPSQLHYILSNYILPDESSDHVIQWTPTASDSWDAINEEKLHESFDSHPEFYLPINGYSMELSNPPQDAQLLHDFVDNLHKQLKENAATSKRDTKTSLQTMVNSSTCSPASPLRKPTLDVSEIVRESPDFTKAIKKSKVKGPHYSHKAIRRNKDRSNSKKQTELRGRVQSILEPKLLAAPEKLVLINIEDEDEVATGSSSLDEEDVENWARNTFSGSPRVIGLQRGNKGFGFILEEKINSPGNLFIKLSDEYQSTGEVSEELCEGDKVLAIDNLIVADTDHSQIRKYIKDAEEEITIVLAPKQCR